LASGTLFRLQAEDFPIFAGYRSTHDVYWDYSRGQVLVATHYGFDVFAFDLATGNLRNRYRGSSAYTNYYSSIETSTGRHLRGRGTFEVFGSWMYIRGNNSLTLFNLDTGENQQVWIADESISVDQVAVSPDGRYLIVGGDTLRVWDLHNLPSSVEARTPQRYNGPEGSIVALRFLDTTTLEIRTVGDNISRWNVTTGLPS
jgi:WD40 repeat protein